MEELIEILIRVIAAFFQNKAPPPPRRTSQSPRPIPTAPPPVAVKKPAPRRAVRRPAPPIIGMAQPIITTVSNVTSAPMVPMARSTIIANAGIQKPNAVPAESAASIRKWLTPATLKNQFLLTEILQPPLALREKRY